jgi:translation initiation factor IF-2
MIKILNELGFPVKSHMSTLETKVVDKVRERFEEEKAAVRKEIANIKKLHEEVRKEKQAKKEKEKKEAISKAKPPKRKYRSRRSRRKPRKTEDKRKTHKSKTEERKKTRKPSKKKTERKPKKSRRQVIIDGKAKAKEKKKKEQKKQKKKPTPQTKKAEEKKVKETVRKTLAEDRKTKKKYKKKTAELHEEEETGKKIIRVSESIPLGGLGKLLNVEASRLIELCEEMGMPVTLNQRLDIDTITLLAEEFDFEVEHVTELSEDLIQEEKKKEDFTSRAPVVTVMGHVDHGKTSLLDYIRQTNVISSEAGGITQHIGAYEVHLDEGNITFIDTPGHAAFTAMRARGAKVTDIVILIVAADDGVMPQTIEAIDHARAAEVPIIVAINKIDLPNANVDRVKNQLAEHKLIPEEWGGETIIVPISALKGEGIDRLLEMVLLQAEIMELEAVPKQPAVGVVIESKVQQGRGSVATVLIQEGTLKTRDAFVTGTHYGRVRSMYNDRGKRVKKAGPSEPVLVMGLSGLPNAGDSFIVVKNEKEAKSIAEKRQNLRKELQVKQQNQKKMSLEDFFTSFQKGEVKELNILIKADTDGSAEALSDALEQLSTKEVKVNIVHKGIGDVVENDVLLATTSDAIIIGFSVDVDSNAKKVIKKEGVDVRRYDIIYKVTEDVTAAMEGLLEPIEVEQILGHAEIRQVFKVPKVGKVAGSYVTSGVITRSAFARVKRDGKVIHDSRIESLRRFKEDVSEVKSGYECGINVVGFSNFEEKDIIEAYEIIKKARKL